MTSILIMDLIAVTRSHDFNPENTNETTFPACYDKKNVLRYNVKV